MSKINSNNRVVYFGESQLLNGVITLNSKNLRESDKLLFKARRKKDFVSVENFTFNKDRIIFQMPVFHNYGRFDLYIFNEMNEEISYEISKETKYLICSQSGSEFAQGVYRNEKGRLTVYSNTKNKVLTDKYKIVLTAVSAKISNKGILSVKIKINHEEKKAVINSMELRCRNSENTILVFPHRNSHKKATFFLDVNEKKWSQFYWDVFIGIQIGEDSFFSRVSQVSLSLLVFSMYFQGYQHYKFNTGYVLYPYVTLSGGFSLNYRLISKYETPRYLLKGLAASIVYLLFGWALPQKKAWLIHEKFSLSAQDNSYYFFKYCNEKHPELPIYYVIDYESPDYKKFHNDKRTLNFMSFRHQLYLMCCKLIVSSESKGHGYAWRVNQGLPKLKLNEKKYVFLQHGVIGFKRLDNTFKSKGVNHADLFVASSDFEKKIIMEFLDYKDSEVIITGLARWDAVKRYSKSGKILYMPTWRNWLDDAPLDIFMKSNYYKNILTFMMAPNFIRFLEKHNLQLLFYVHPKFLDKTDTFRLVNNDRVILIPFGSKAIRDLIDESDILITDYSSVIWDFYYRNKPVLLYQFDREDYDNYQGSYIDFDKQKIAPVFETSDELIKELEIYMNRKVKVNYGIEDKSKYFKYIDAGNSERIFSEITAYIMKISKFNIKIHEWQRSPLMRFFWKKIKKMRRTSRWIVKYIQNH